MHYLMMENMSSNAQRYSLPCLLLLVSTLFMAMKPAVAQVTFNPTVLMMGQEDPVHEIQLTNLSDQPQEVEIIEQFGYPTSDEKGKLIMVYDDSTKAAAYGFMGKLRIYPSKMIIPARSRQVVRVQVRRQEDMKDRTFWTRLGIRSQAISEEVGKVDSVGGGTRISYVIQQNMGVFYKHGDVFTGLDLKNISHQGDKDTLDLLLSVERTGNSPYLGLVQVRLQNAGGEEIAFAEKVVGIYFDAVIRLQLIAEEMLAGSYQLQTIFKTTRGDIKDEDILRAEDQIFMKKLIIEEEKQVIDD